MFGPMFNLITTPILKGSGVEVPSPDRLGLILKMLKSPEAEQAAGKVGPDSTEKEYSPAVQAKLKDKYEKKLAGGKDPKSAFMQKLKAMFSEEPI